MWKAWYRVADRLFERQFFFEGHVTIFQIRSGQEFSLQLLLQLGNLFDQVISLTANILQSIHT